MPNYRRIFAPGGTFFFTVNLLDRGSRLLTDKHDLLMGAISKVRASYSFDVDALVVLPDHLHTIWTLPESDSDYALRWRYLKAAFSREIEPDDLQTLSRIHRRERGIWQRRFWEHTIHDDRDYIEHL